MERSNFCWIFSVEVSYALLLWEEWVGDVGREGRERGGLLGEQPCEGGRVTPPPGAGLGGIMLLCGIVAILGL